MIKRSITVLTFAAFFSLIAGCGGGKENANSQAAKSDAHTHDGGTVHSDHSAESTGGGAGHGGPVIDLGTATIGSYTVRASRDQGEIKPSGDAPIDVWLTGGDISKVTAVRFWIGNEQGDNYVKVKADIEIPSEPNHWHTHAEVPNPIPAGSNLWVEIEVDGKKQVGAFDLKN